MSAGPRLDTCELWANKQWVEITIEDALRMDESRKKRCVECHGQVRAHSASEDGMRAHFEHLRAHPGCSRGHVYDGTSTRHPKALS